LNLNFESGLLVVVRWVAKLKEMGGKVQGDRWLSYGDGWLSYGDGWLSQGDGWLSQGDRWLS
jgi:hypothetical protein